MTALPEMGPAHAWLSRASRDLEKASVMSEFGVFEPGDLGAYAQQAAEKSLKAVLVHEGAGVPRIHDLRELRSRCAARIAPHITDERLDALSALWVRSRYPGDWTEPTRADADEALEVALAFVSDAARIIAEKENT